MKHLSWQAEADSFSLISPGAKPIILLTPPLTEEETMKANNLLLLTLSFFLIPLFLLVGCAEKGKNSPPSALKLSADRLYVVAGGTVFLHGEATDTDGDSLTISWKASSGSGSAGSFNPPSAIGADVSWIAPDRPGPVAITMTATDELATSSKTQNVTVCVRFPSPIRTSKSIANGGYAYIMLEPEPVRIEGVTLTIDPGVTLVIDGADGGFEALGSIVAAGTPSQKIRITGNEGLHGNSVKLLPWGGIVISGQSGMAVFKHAEISRATDGIQAEEEATLTLDSCDVFGVTSYGVSVLHSSSATIHSCKIWDNGTGIYVLNSAVDIRSCSIRYSAAKGVELSASDSTLQAVIENCEIANHKLDCIVVKGVASPAIHYNSIYSSGEIQDGSRHYAIRLFGDYSATGPIHAENNFWGIGNTSAEKIRDLIFDREDNELVKAYVSFDPWLDSLAVQPKSGRD